nr:immunoglobulin heavy chain junction region [Macaca mulatta]
CVIVGPYHYFDFW